MCILNLSFPNQSISVLKEEILNVLEFQLSAQQQRTMQIASAIFAALIGLFALYYFISKANQSNIINDGCSRAKTKQVAKDILNSPLLSEEPKYNNQERGPTKLEISQKKPIVFQQSSKSKENKESLRDQIQQQSSNSIAESPKNITTISIEVNPRETRQLDLKDDSQIDKESLKIDQTDVESWEWELNKENWETDIDEYILNIENESELGKKSVKVQASKEKYYLNGKKISYRTLRCLQILEKNLEELEKVYGTAIDNGDCFWGAFAQRLSVILKRVVTLKERR